MSQIHERLGNTLCRRCIARKYHVDLQPMDCKYEIYPSVCDCCDTVHNIVIGLNGSGRRKLLFR